MCCIRGIRILAPGANVSANPIFHPVTIYVISEKIKNLTGDHERHSEFA